MEKKKFGFKTVLESLDVAFSMYSALPMPQIMWNEQNMKYMLAFFPLVGLVQGALLMGWVFLAEYLQVNAIVFAAIAMLIPLLVTGGIHLDGLCDTIDARASHQEREKKLEILKDPHTGAFAVMGCAAYLLLTFALWTQPVGADRLLTAKMMSVGYVLSRAMSTFAVVLFPCAKNSGLVHAFSSAAQKKNVRIAAVLYILICAGTLLWIDLLAGAIVLAGCGLVFWYYHHMAMKEFGGTTGDLAGYFLQINEIVMLLICVGISVLSK